MQRERGIVKMFDRARGFGFATRRGKTDVFVHCKQLPGDVDWLDVGQPISFTVATDAQGRTHADNVEIE